MNNSVGMLVLFAERDPEPIIPAKIEALLFSALDGETDAATAAQLQATIQTLLAAGAHSRPSHYLTACSQVILAATAVSDSKDGKAQDTLQGDEGALQLVIDVPDKVYSIAAREDLPLMK